MAYSAEIGRANPCCFVILLDQSGSMNQPFEGQGTPAQPLTKAQGVADAVNRLIGELVISCAKGEEVLDRFHLAVITYGADQAALAPGFTGIMAISEVAAHPLRVVDRVKEGYDGLGGIVKMETRFPVWFDPTANGNTPMGAALDKALSLLEPWTASHPNSFPPIVFNITDGVPTDGDPTPGLQRLQALSTEDGACLVFNMLLAAGVGDRIAYPASSASLPPGPLATLVDGSSPLPEPMRKRACQDYEMTLAEGARGVVLNASIVDVVKLLDIGSRPINA